MKRHANIGLAAVSAVVGFIGWSVADGLTHRPQIVPGAPTAVGPEVAAPPAAPAAGEGAAGSACCKDKAHQAADHADCKMKKAEGPPPPSDSAAKCPYRAGAAAKGQ